MRIVSLLPSATELLCQIPGGAEMLVGRSHECDWPPRILQLPTLTRQRTTATTSEAIDAEVRRDPHAAYERSFVEAIAAQGHLQGIVGRPRSPLKPGPLTRRTKEHLYYAAQ